MSLLRRCFPKGRRAVHLLGFVIGLMMMLRSQTPNGMMMNWRLDHLVTSIDGAAEQKLLAVARAHKNQNYMRACVIVGSDNLLLAQWVAYHYTALPLRRLIVGLDENFTEDAMDVLSRWNGTDLQFEVWYPNDYEAHTVAQVAEAKGRFWNRQQRFYRRCLEHFHRQQDDLGWVALVDTDEFIKLNPLDDFLVPQFVNETSYSWDNETIKGSLPFMAPNETLWDRIQARKQLRQRLGLDQANDTSAPQTPNEPLLPTVLDVLEEYSSEHGTLPCHSMSRRRYGAVVDNFDDLASTRCQPKLDSHITASINISKISTIQFLYHAFPLSFTHNEWAKVVVDLRRMPYDSLAYVELSNPHRPLQECPLAFMPDLFSLIHANHYSNFWSVYISRRRSNAENSIKKEQAFWAKDAHIRDHTRCDHIHGWLNEFVDEFGMDKAKRLLMDDV